MPKLSVKRALTSKPITVYIRKISDGRPLTGLVFNTASLVANYRREGDATVTAITLVTATVGTWTSGGFREVDPTNQPGMYELGLPNAALASGAVVTGMLRGASDMLECPFEVQLDAIDAQDAVAFGLSRLDVAVSSRNAIAPDNATVAAIKAKTDNLPASPAATGGLATLTLSQAIPNGQVAGTVGYALEAAEAQGSGRWVLSPDGLTLTCYRADGVTVFRAFTLDAAPPDTTSRT